MASRPTRASTDSFRAAKKIRARAPCSADPCRDVWSGRREPHRIAEPTLHSVVHSSTWSRSAAAQVRAAHHGRIKRRSPLRSPPTGSPDAYGRVTKFTRRLLGPAIHPSNEVRHRHQGRARPLPGSDLRGRAHRPGRRMTPERASSWAPPMRAASCGALRPTQLNPVVLDLAQPVAWRPGGELTGFIGGRSDTRSARGGRRSASGGLDAVPRCRVEVSVRCTRPAGARDHGRSRHARRGGLGGRDSVGRLPVRRAGAGRERQGEPSATGRRRFQNRASGQRSWAAYRSCRRTR